MMRSYIVGLPGGDEESAQVDGRDALRAFSRIVLPLTVPGRSRPFTFAFIFS